MKLSRHVGKAVLSKPMGAGAMERNWADVKVFDKKKAGSKPERVEKNTKIYGMSRRDPALLVSSRPASRTTPRCGTALD